MPLTARLFVDDAQIPFFFHTKPLSLHLIIGNEYNPGYDNMAKGSFCQIYKMQAV